MHDDAAPRTMTAPFGPWSPDVTPVEGGKQLRCMGGIVACHCGSGHPLITTLRDAELDGEALRRAAVLLDRLPSLVARRIISTFGAVTWPRRAP